MGATVRNIYGPAAVEQGEGGRNHMRSKIQTPNARSQEEDSGEIDSKLEISNESWLHGPGSVPGRKPREGTGHLYGQIHSAVRGSGGKCSSTARRPHNRDGLGLDPPH